MSYHKMMQYLKSYNDGSMTFKMLKAFAERIGYEVSKEENGDVFAKAKE